MSDADRATVRAAFFDWYMTFYNMDESDQDDIDDACEATDFFESTLDRRLAELEKP